MIINGKWMSETEIIALISQLTADKKRLERQLEQGVKRGEIIPLTDAEKIERYKQTGHHFDVICSECGSCVFDTDNFCAECGARLKDGESK